MFNAGNQTDRRSHASFSRCGNEGPLAISNVIQSRLWAEPLGPSLCGTRAPPVPNWPLGACQ